MSADTHDTPRPLGEISQEPNKLDQFLERHHKSLIVLGILVALGAAGYIIHREMKKGSEIAAGAALSQAEDMAAFQKIIKEHPGTAAAGSSEILLAEKQWADGQQDAAIETLKKFIAGQPDHAAIPTARASLGSKLAAQGKNDEATKTFEELSSGENGAFLAPYALLSLGDLARSAGDLTKAETYYTRAQNEYASSTFANTAISRLALLKAKPPVEIEPPPAPAEPSQDAPSNLIPAPSIPGLLPTPEAPAETPPPAPAPAPAPAEPAPSPAPAPTETQPAPNP